MNIRFAPPIIDAGYATDHKPSVNSVIEDSRKTPATGDTDQKKTIASIPYIKGTSERMEHLQKNICNNLATFSTSIWLTNQQ